MARFVWLISLTKETQIYKIDAFRILIFETFRDFIHECRNMCEWLNMFIKTEAHLLVCLIIKTLKRDLGQYREIEDITERLGWSNKRPVVPWATLALQ